MERPTDRWMDSDRALPVQEEPVWRTDFMRMEGGRARTSGGGGIDRHEEGGGAGRGVGRTEWSRRPGGRDGEHRKALRKRGPVFPFTDTRMVFGTHLGTDDKGNVRASVSSVLYPPPRPAPTKQSK